MRRVLAFVVALLRAVPSDALTVSPLSRIRASASKLARSAEISMALPRVVVTGMGIVSCLGTTLDEVQTALYDCKPGITFCQEFADIGMISKVSGMPTFDCDELIDRKKIRFMGQNSKYAYIAMQRAIEDSGLKPEEYESTPRVGGIIGQADTSAENIDEVCQAVAGKKRIQSKVGPYRVTRTMSSSVSAVLSTQFKLQGTAYSISSACATSAHCIGTGMEQIQLGKQDIVFCGAGECGGWRSAVMFDAMRALSSNFNDNPTIASRAFDSERDGFVFGAGGGMVVLEELEHAKARGAKIYGEITGYAATSDGYDMVAPSGEGGARAMDMAMDMADQIGGKKNVDYVNTHGTSTPVGDGAELKAIKSTFKARGYDPYIGSTKSLTGHALGAAGVHEAIYSLLMLNKGFLAESANINELDEAAVGLNILTKRYDGDVSRVMSNSFGFGGTNCCLIFDKYDAS
jgi:3-oxoacyl-(acyl-carrier-protein) synthase